MPASSSCDDAYVCLFTCPSWLASTETCEFAARSFEGSLGLQSAIPQHTASIHRTSPEAVAAVAVDVVGFRDVNRIQRDVLAHHVPGAARQRHALPLPDGVEPEACGPGESALSS